MINSLFKNKKFGIFGLGVSGLATINYLKRSNVEFVAYDDKLEQIEKISSNNKDLLLFFKDLSVQEWKQLDYLILSPGIPNTHQVVELAKTNNAKIICDIELFYLLNQNSYFIGITGTNGKSTTTSLIEHILKFNGFNAVTGGNIGRPVMQLESSSDSIYVFELSSFQLDLIDKMRLNLAVLLNITPDHLDRHGNMENYINAKYRIFKNQQLSDKAIINIDLQKVNNTVTFSASRNADFTVINNILAVNENSYPLPENIYLKGEHNQQNIAAAIACCYNFGISIENILRAIPSFVGLKHRMQFAGELNDVMFINDSKATNADSTSNALKTFDNIIWIVGGTPKADGIEPLKCYFNKIKIALLIGKSQDDFAKTCSDTINWQKCETLENAFNEALKISSPGDVVLLSPACASYDQWRNFEERGDYFLELVKKVL